MTLSTFCIAASGILYLGTVIGFLIEGKPWNALIFVGYVIAQIGFLFA